MGSAMSYPSEAKQVIASVAMDTTVYCEQQCLPLPLRSGVPQPLSVTNAERLSFHAATCIKERRTSVPPPMVIEVPISAAFSSRAESSESLSPLSMSEFSLRHVGSGSALSSVADVKQTDAWRAPLDEAGDSWSGQPSASRRSSPLSATHGRNRWDSPTPNGISHTTDGDDNTHLKMLPPRSAHSLPNIPLASVPPPQPVNNELLDAGAKVSGFSYNTFSLDPLGS